MTDPNPELYEAITEHWGERCAEYDPGCFCCRAWDQFDAIAELQKRLGEIEAKEGPLNAESITLDELLEVLAKWKAVASGKTCVSFESLCYGASSLWHQTHRDNFRKIDRKPLELSRWVLGYSGAVMEDFPAQVLAILDTLKHKREEEKLRAEAAEAKLAEAKARLIPEEIMLRENAAIRRGLTQNQEQTIALERRNADQRKSNQLLAEKHREVLRRADTAEAKLAAVRERIERYKTDKTSGNQAIHDIHDIVKEPTNAE